MNFFFSFSLEMMHSTPRKTEDDALAPGKKSRRTNTALRLSDFGEGTKALACL